MEDDIRCFDWVASIYDATRALPEELYPKIGASIKQYVSIQHPFDCLEIGVGTGRIASCFAESLQCKVIGVDISQLMLFESLNNPLTSDKLNLIAADGNYLPFKHHFNLILTSHVLHLVKDHFQLIRSIIVNLAPCGTYIDLNAHVDHEQTLPFKIFYEYLAENGYRHFFRNDLIRKELRVFFTHRGWDYHEMSITSQYTILMNNLVRFLKNRVFSHQRMISDYLYFKALNHLYEELEHRNVDLYKKISVPAYAHLLIFSPPEKHSKNVNKK